MHTARFGERLPRLQIQFRISRSFRPRNLANLGSKIRFWIRRKEHTLKFGSAFLSSSWESKIALFFLTFPYPVPVPKNCVIFIGCKSRASQVGLHKEKKDTASAKKGKVSLHGRGG